MLSVLALTRLEQTVYSHLNSFCDVEIRGHRELSLEFSPCPGVAIDVLPFDYPFGRPARFAFLDRAGTFRVVEASSGEKGPFKLLASGPLAATSRSRSPCSMKGSPWVRSHSPTGRNRPVQPCRRRRAGACR